MATSTGGSKTTFVYNEKQFPTRSAAVNVEASSLCGIYVVHHLPMMPGISVAHVL